MKIQVLGGHGGLARGFNTTSFLIDDVLLVDAGAVAGTLSVEEQCRIDHILISHCHLDHIKDLAFISDNCFGIKKSPFEVFTHSAVKKIIKDHLLNDLVWPDFTKLPSESKPTMRIHAIEPEMKIVIGNYEVTPVEVNHAHHAMGFIIEKDGVAVLLTSDTGATEKIWQIGKTFKNLKGIITEVSFPNRLHQVAEVSQHHTPASIKEEIKKMPASVPVILTHLKPGLRSELIQEIESLNEPRLKVLEEDGVVFHF